MEIEGLSQTIFRVVDFLCLSTLIDTDLINLTPLIYCTACQNSKHGNRRIHQAQDKLERKMIN